MPDALLYALVLVAALACPGHLWWVDRRGKRPLCRLPKREPAARDVDALPGRRRSHGVS
jgi:hypothetical protein